MRRRWVDAAQVVGFGERQRNDLSHVVNLSHVVVMLSREPAHKAEVGMAGGQLRALG